MSDLIEREEVIKSVRDCKAWHFCDLIEVLSAIKAIPSARPKEGKWIVYEGGWKDLDYYPPKCKCDQCGYEEELYILNAKPTNFCPNCGSDNRERNDDE